MVKVVGTESEYSVLLSVYIKESPNLFELSLDSILDQSKLPSQIVLVKDGPLTPQLEKVIKKFLLNAPDEIKMDIISNEKNLGLAKSLAKGLEYCENELVARVDTDDINRNDRMERQIDFFIRNTDVSVLGSNILESVDGIEKTSRMLPLNYEEILTFSKKRNPLNHMSVMFKKSHVMEVGNYENVPFFEDYYLWVKLLNKGFKIYNLSEPLVKANFDNNSLKRRRGINYIGLEIAFQKKILNMGFLNRKEFLRNIFLRGVPRILPFFIFKYLFILKTRMKSENV